VAALEAPTRIRCAKCGWAWEGPFSAGLEAARAHRSAKHPDLPERTPNPRRKKHDKQARPRISDERQEAVLAVLREAERPLRAGEIAARLGLSAYAVGAALRFIEDAYQPAPAVWALQGRDFGDVEIPRPPRRDPAETELKPKRTQNGPSRKLRAKRDAFERAVEELRASGKTVVAVHEIVSASGLPPVSVGKFCRSAGYQRAVRRPRVGNAKPTLYDISGTSQIS
jgi:hypothetical protein